MTVFAMSIHGLKELSRPRLGAATHLMTPNALSRSVSAAISVSILWTTDRLRAVGESSLPGQESVPYRVVGRAEPLGGLWTS